MTENEAIDLAQEILKTAKPSQETIDSLMALEDYISEEIFGDLIEALIVILPSSLLQQV
jgi:hypothetical protein